MNSGSNWHSTVRNGTLYLHTPFFWCGFMPVFSYNTAVIRSQ